MQIITNNKPRDLLYGWELDKEEQREFDHLEFAATPLEENQAGDWHRFIRYRGEVYDLADFVRIVPRARAVCFEHGADEDSPLLSWSGIMTDSYFSGLVIRWAKDDCTGEPDFDRVIVGRVYS